MFFRQGHVILVLRNISYKNHCDKRSVSQQLSKLLEYNKAYFHGTNCSWSIFHTQRKQPVYTDVPDVGQPMEAWFYDVKKDGKLMVNSAMDVHVQPLDPQKHPSMNKLFINILYMGKDRLSSSELTALTKQYIVNVNLDDSNAEMEISIKRKSRLFLPALCHLQVPLKYGVEVWCTKDGSATLENLESENIKVRTNRGDCKFKGIKGFNIEVRSNEGNILSTKVLQGNTSVVCGGNGSVDIARLQGQNVTCNSDQGDINVKAIYADNSTFTSNTGNIHLGSCHGDSEVKIREGHFRVDTLDGNLNGSIGCGDSQISLAREGNVKWEVENGDISVSVPESLNCKLDVSGTDVDSGEVTIHNTDISKEKNLTKLTGNLSKEPIRGSIETRTNNGKVKLSYYNWLSSLNLGKK